MTRNYLRASGLLAVALMATLWSASADAGLLFRNRVADESLPTPPAAAMPVSALTQSAEPGCCVPAAPVCCPAPCITYRHAGLCKVKCCGCEPPVQTVLSVNDPCTCCPVAIPVCLPSCCTGAPTVSCRPTLLARGSVTYDWCCGVSVTVRFQKDGDILVTYRGA